MPETRDTETHGLLLAVVLIGDAIGIHQITGPFASMDHAVQWGQENEQYFGLNWVAKEIHPPVEEASPEIEVWMRRHALGS